MYNSYWYNSLNKPFLSPPSEIFAPVWTVLYILMLISLLMYLRTLADESKLKGCIFFVIQLVLNLLWSPAFFLLQNIGLALIIVILLDIFVILTVSEFKKVSKLSAILLIPYLLWILFATYLNIGYLVLN